MSVTRKNKAGAQGVCSGHTAGTETGPRERSLWWPQWTIPGTSASSTRFVIPRKFILQFRQQEPCTSHCYRCLFPRSCLLMMPTGKCKALLKKQAEEWRLPGILWKTVSSLSHTEICNKANSIAGLIVIMVFLLGRAEICFLITGSCIDLCLDILLFNNHLASIWNWLAGLYIFVLNINRHWIISITGFLAHKM